MKLLETLAAQVTKSTCFLYIAAYLVQAFMLCQAGLTYLLLRWRHRNSPIPPGLCPLDTRALGANSRLSIIVPAFNEATTIAATLRRVATSAYDPKSIEVIVVDAGGSDGTMLVVENTAAELTAIYPELIVRTNISARGGRGPTLSAGYQASTGGFLLFLHADTLLPHEFDVIVRDALREERVLATAFRFQVERPAKGEKPIVGLGWMEATVFVRSRCYELPFGDQALAMTRQRFVAIGGFPDNFKIMEDFELVQRLRRCGAGGAGYIRTLNESALCSARRWTRHGVWWTNLVNQAIMILYVYWGYTPDRIYDIYYHFDFATWLKEMANASENRLAQFLGIREANPRVPKAD